MPLQKARKLYLHFKGEQECTQVLKNVGSAVTVEELCAQFADAVKVTQGLDLDSRQLQIATAKGRVFGRSHLVHKAFDSDADVNVSVRAGQHDKEIEIKASGDGATYTLPVKEPCSGGRSATDHRHIEDAAAATEPEGRRVSPLIAPLLAQASQKEAAQHLKAASFIYQQVHGMLY
jgi:hypothetical protein